MRIGYLCFNGHLTVGRKEQNLVGNLPEKIFCIHCGTESTVHEEHTLSENVPAHFEFFKPAIVEDKEQQELLSRGYLLMRPFEDPILTREFQATQNMLKLVGFMVNNIPVDQMLDEPIDTAIEFIKKGLKYDAEVQSKIRMN